MNSCQDAGVVFLLGVVQVGTPGAGDEVDDPPGFGPGLAVVRPVEGPFSRDLAFDLPGSPATNRRGCIALVVADVSAEDDVDAPLSEAPAIRRIRCSLKCFLDELKTRWWKATNFQVEPFAPARSRSTHSRSTESVQSA